jgi:hypothetical protein
VAIVPLVPHYPSDDPDPRDSAPDLNEIVDRILSGDGGGDPSPGVV